MKSSAMSGIAASGSPHCRPFSASRCLPVLVCGWSCSKTALTRSRPPSVWSSRSCGTSKREYLFRRRCASSASYSSSTSLSYASLMRMPFFSLDAASRVRSAVCRTAVLLGPAPIAVGRRRCGGSPWFCLEAGLSPGRSTTCPPHAGPPVKRSGSVFLSRGAAGALVRSLATQTRRRLG